MFVAVVYKHHEDTDPYDSHHTDGHGGWTCFIAPTAQEAADKAGVWAQRWQTEYKLKTGTDGVTIKKYKGPYRILVGELTEEGLLNQLSMKKFV